MLFDKALLIKQDNRTSIRKQASGSTVTITETFCRKAEYYAELLDAQLQ